MTNCWLVLSVEPVFVCMCVPPISSPCFFFSGCAVQSTCAINHRVFSFPLFISCMEGLRAVLCRVTSLAVSLFSLLFASSIYLYRV